jgi:hypothetical protein
MFSMDIAVPIHRQGEAPQLRWEAEAGSGGFRGEAGGGAAGGAEAAGAGVWGEEEEGRALPRRNKGAAGRRQEQQQLYTGAAAGTAAGSTGVDLGATSAVSASAERSQQWQQPQQQQWGLEEYPVKWQGLAVEVDGPTHFLASHPGEQDGSSLLRNRLLEKSGWRVLVVPVTDFQRARLKNPQAPDEGRREYLLQLLEEQGLVEWLKQLRRQEPQ